MALEFAPESLHLRLAQALAALAHQVLALPVDREKEDGSIFFLIIIFRRWQKVEPSPFSLFLKNK